MKKLAHFPDNCDNEIKGLLNKHRVSYHKSNKLLIIKNAFISYEGLVIKNFLLVIGCAFNLVGFRDKTFYFQFWKLAIEKFLVSKYGRSIPYIKTTETVAVIHSKWFNYAFWINSYLPRLLELIESGEDFKLMYPEHWDNIPYVKLILDELPVEKIRIPPGHQLFAKRLILPQTRRWTSSFDVRRIQLVRNKLITLSDTKIEQKHFPKKIYLTRKYRGNRCAENEVELLELLKKYEYEAVVFEDYSVWEQVKMMSKATHFISIHGAGLTNFIFMQDNTEVIELVNRQYAIKEYTFPFWKLSQTVNVNYSIQLCDAVNQNGELGYGKNKKDKVENDFLVNSNLYVDLDILEQKLT